MDPPHDFLAKLAEDQPSFAELAPLTVHTRTGLGDTPLHVAATRGDVRAILLLLDAGADIDARGEHGFTPLHEAVLQRRVEAVRTLLARDAARMLRNDWKQTPLELAQGLPAPEIAALFAHSRG